MVTEYKKGEDVIAYFASEHGKTLGRITRYVKDGGKSMTKDGFLYAESRGSWVSVPPADVFFYGREITEEQAREWIRELGGDPDIVLSDKAILEYPEKDIEPDPYY